MVTTTITFQTKTDLIIFFMKNDTLEKIVILCTTCSVHVGTWW